MEKAITERLRDTVYVVDATHEEAHGLWREYSREAANGGWGSAKNTRVIMEQISYGWGINVGTCGEMPVMLALNWYRIEGHLVLFWEPTSTVVDYRLCEAWLKEHCAAYRDGQHTNSTNFSHCLHHVQALPATIRTARAQAR